MSLTLPAAYSAASKQGNIQENWLIQIGYFNGDAQGKGEGGWDAVLQPGGSANLLTADVDTSTETFPTDDGTVFTVGDHLKVESEIVKIHTIVYNNVIVTRAQMGTSAEAHENNDAIYWNNFTPIALGSTTVDSVYYHGVITNKPSVRESINLVRSTARVSNISIDLVNFQYKGDDFSAEVLSGTRTYLNKDVRVYIQLNGSTALSDCLHIYTGKLYGIQHGDDKISLSIKSYSPWDRINYPDVYSAEKVLAPLSFGAFAGNDSEYPGTGTDNWRPIPFTLADSAYAYFITGVTEDGSTSKHSQYVPTRDGFVPFTTTSDSTTTAGSIERVNVGVNGKYRFQTTPTSDSENSTATGWAESSIGQSYNLNTGNAGTYAYSENVSVAPGTARVHVQRYVIPETEEGAQIVLTYRISNYDKHTDVDSLELVAELSTAADTAESSAHAADTGSDQTLTLVTTAATAYVDLKLTAELEIDEATSGGTGVIHLDAYVLSVSNIKNEDSLETVYSDAAGELKSYTSGSVANIHEAHRSLLHSALGLTDTPTGWSALDTERVGSPDAWTILYWQNDQGSIAGLLKLLQYEGQFIYIYQRSAGRYIFIADSPSSIATLTKEDIANFSINQVSFDELETKHIINYSPHPAKDEYRSQATQTSGDRSDYNFAAGENIITVTLRALAAAVSGGSARNDDWATYRQKLFGSIKLTVQFSLINPAYSNLEVGDIIDFGTMNVDPGGGSWSGKDFIIIQTRRKPGNISVIAREV